MRIIDIENRVLVRYIIRHIYYVSRVFSCKVGCTLEEMGELRTLCVFYGIKSCDTTFYKFDILIIVNLLGKAEDGNMLMGLPAV